MILFAAYNNEFVGKDHFDTKVGVSNVVYNGVTYFYFIPWVHDFFIIVASRGLFASIFIRVPSFSYNVIFAFADREKIIGQVFGVGVGFMD